MFALIGALNRKVERLFNPDRKDIIGGKRKLKRDELLTSRNQQSAVVPRDLFIRRVWSCLQFLCCRSATKLLFLFRN